MAKKNTYLLLYLMCYSFDVTNAIPQFSSVDPFVQVAEDFAIDSILFNFTISGSSSVSPFPSNLIYIQPTSFDETLNYNVSVYLKSGLDREIQSSHTLTFRASDSIGNDVPKNLVLYVTDVNDNHPVFENIPYFWDIPELPYNQTEEFKEIFANDPDRGVNGTVRYSFMADTQSDAAKIDYMETFDIDHIHGNVSLKKQLDYMKNAYYQFTVTATDLGTPDPLQSNVSLVIRVKDVQNMPPFFTGAPYRTSVVEEKSSGTSVITVTARDGDTGVPNPVSYTITEGSSCENLFTINRTTGLISTDGILDRDNGTIYDVSGVCVLTILATEIEIHLSEFGNTTATTNITITVTDINDNSPTFNNGIYHARIEENTQSNVPLQLDGQQIVVSDLDQGDFATIDISLQWPNSTTCSDFKVSPNVVYQNGSPFLQVGNSALLDYETIRNLSFEIIATEKANTSHVTSATVYLQIEDVNDNTPQFDNKSYSFDIFEEPKSGSLVGNITATDPDSGNYKNISYSLLGSEDKFRIDAWSGEITTICEPKDLDRETISVYYLTVTATDDGGSSNGRSNSTSVRINLLDKNDNAPMFLRDKYQVFVKENEDFSRIPLVTVSAQDRDQIDTNNSKVMYTLQGDPWVNSIVSVNQSNGVIHLLHPIDYEKLPNQTTGVFNFLVIGTDLGHPSLSGNTTIEITVEDLNDNAPIFNQSIYHAQVQENATSTVRSLFIVTNVSASDKDGSTRNNRIQYLILDGAQNQFAVNSESGSVYVQRNVALDRETQPAYNITILAIDLASNPLNGTTTVLIDIIDVNDEAPEFNKTMCNTIEIPEDESVDKTVASCIATDPDSGHNLKYSIIDYEATDENSNAVNATLIQGYFKINSSSGQVYVANDLDRETAERIQLTILVEDQQAELNMPQNDTKVLSVTLLDVNDNDPVFHIYNYTMSVRENAIDGANLDSVSATDRDKNRTITYSILAGEEPISSFSINKETGQISKTGPVDREQNKTVVLHVMASDSGVPSRNATTTVLINVIDFNDNNPIFYPNSTGLNRTVYENETVGADIVTIMAYDLDEGRNAEVTFEIENGAHGDFQIGEVNGSLFTVKELDREIIDKYIIRIIAKDNPLVISEQNRNQTTVTVYIRDINDNSPEFNRPVYPASVTEIADVGTVIQSITATDKDAGINSRLSYYFGNDTEPPGLFMVDKISGNIKVNSSLRTHVGDYVLELIAEDGGMPSLSGSTLVNITITDHNIHPPVIGNLPENDTIRVFECFQPGTVIHEFNYTDADKGDNAKAYFNITAIEEDNVLEKFEITANGQLKLKATLNANVASSYRFQIEATDRGSPTPLSSDKYTLSILVIDVNNFLPGFDKDHIDFSVEENKPNGTFVGTVTALDEDKDSVTCYNISGKFDRDFFEIEQYSGTITTKRHIDREVDGDILQITVNTWDCTVSHNECGNNSSPPVLTNRPNITVNIHILDVDDNPPVFVSSEISVGMRRNEDVDFVLDLDLKTGGYVKDNDTVKYGRQSWIFQNNGSAIVSSELQNKVQPATGVNECSPGGEQNLFCITGNGSVVNNKYFSEDMAGYFLLPVSVRDAAGNDQTTLKIYLISDFQVLVMTIFDVKQSVGNYRDELLQLYGNITGHKFVYDGLQDHKTPSGGIDTTKADLLFHIVDPKTDRILPSDEAQRLIDSFYDKLRQVTIDYKVLEVLASTGAQVTEEDDPMRTVYILTAVVVLLALTVAVIIYVSFTLRNRYKRKIKALSVDKTVIAKEESNNFIPGSNQYSKTSNPLLNAKIDTDTHYDKMSLSSNDSIDKNEVDTARDDASYDKMETKEKTMDLFMEHSTFEDVESPLEAAIRMHEINRASLETEGEADIVDAVGDEADPDDNTALTTESVTIHGYVNEVFDMESSDI